MLLFVPVMNPKFKFVQVSVSFVSRSGAVGFGRPLFRSWRQRRNGKEELKNELNSQQLGIMYLLVCAYARPNLYSMQGADAHRARMYRTLSVCICIVEPAIAV